MFTTSKRLKCLIDMIDGFNNLVENVVLGGIKSSMGQ